MPSVDRSAQITLRALVTARWVLLGLLAATDATVALWPELVAPLVDWFPKAPDPMPLMWVWAAWALVNVLTDRLVLRRGKATAGLAGLHLLIDATVLTVLLGLSGGTTNPFTTAYLVPITLATQVSPRWTWALAAYCLAGFEVLFLMEPQTQHLRGMWLAFGVSGLLITYFVHLIALALARQRQELSRLREQALQDRHLAALGTLAAGAAHELGTPLGSIHLLVGELPHMSRDERHEAMSTIQREVARCKGIVHRMASPELSAQDLWADGGGPPWRLGALGEHALEAARDSGVLVSVGGQRDVELRQPRVALEQIVRELVTNAIDACRRRADGRGEVRVQLSRDDEDVIVEVRDTGVGMEPELAANAFDPFWSTKAEGEGMGLGLYLARAQLRQLGGTLELESSPGRGTTLRMILPIHPDPTRSGRSLRDA